LSTRVIAALALTALALALPARAEPETADQLKTVEKNLRSSQQEQDQLQREGETVAKDLAHAQQARVALAKDIQDQEYAITLLENRVQRLEADVNQRGAALARRDKQMGQALLALERLALHPGDALTFTPLAPDDAVRAAILLRAAVPEIAASTGALQAELADLYRERAEVVAQREQVAAGAALLVAKRTELDALIETKTARQATVSARSQDVKARVDTLSHQAEDLRALFAKLAEEKARRDAAERKATAEAAAAKGSQAPPALSAEERASAAAEAAARPFSKARGTLPFPAIGKVVTRYGDDKPNGPSKGITIATRSGATVVTPYDGVVAFAGPFRGYGQLLIVEHSEGYHTLMSGMVRLDAVVGQHVLAGEPVAVMGNDPQPMLYVELRRDGQPINPLPWLAQRATAARE
jgi:septal ring factor EnvC (AmiA/AmiB activator)